MQFIPNRLSMRIGESTITMSINKTLPIAKCQLNKCPYKISICCARQKLLLLCTFQNMYSLCFFFFDNRYFFFAHFPIKPNSKGITDIQNIFFATFKTEMVRSIRSAMERDVQIYGKWQSSTRSKLHSFFCYECIKKNVKYIS